MKIEVVDERVFPTLGLVANAGDSVDVPDDSTPAPQVESAPNDSPKADKAATVKDGDTDGSSKV